MTDDPTPVLEIRENNSSVFTYEVPQADLQFVLKDGKRILQQKWLVVHNQVPRPEWRDVPLVTE